jgi:hypothetical protein
MSFLKLVKLAKKFEIKLQREGQAVKYVTGPGQSVQVDPNSVQLPLESEHEKRLSEVPPPQPERPQPVVMPEAHITGKRPSNPNVLNVQNFLNQELAVKNPVMAPITPNGHWNQETANALRKWREVSGFKGMDLNKGFTAALAKATGKQVVNQLGQTPALDAARKSV